MTIDLRTISLATPTSSSYLIVRGTNVEESYTTITTGNGQHAHSLTRMPSQINNSTSAITSLLFPSRRVLMIRIPQSLHIDRSGL